MNNQLLKTRQQFIIILALILLSSLLSFYDFNLFHVTVTIYSIIICFIVFIIILNTHQIISNNYYIFLGIAFGFVGAFEFIYTCYYQGISVIPYITSANVGQIWYLSRFTQALALLLSFLFVSKKLKIRNIIISFSIYTAALFSAIFYYEIHLFQYIPRFDILGVQVENNYLIIAVLLFTLFIFKQRKVTFSEFHYNNMSTAIIFFIISELFFMLPAAFEEFADVFGQITRLLSFYFIYRSVVLTSLKEPYNTIFYKLTQSNKKLSDLNQILNIVKNIHETINVNYELENLFEKIVNILINKEDYQMAFIGEYIEENSEIKIRSSVGVSSDFLNKETIKLKDENNTVVQAIKRRRIIKDNNPQAVLNIFEKTNKSIHNSLIALPICYDSKIYGVLVITSYREEAFNERVVELLRKITENLGVAITRYLTQQRIRYMSFHDQLTGLYNKNFFNEEISRLDTSRKLPISIIITDFNDLKYINDNYGHKIGDKFLKTYAKILKKNSRQEDIIARWGGDEFVILLPNTTKELTEKLLDRLKNAVDKIEIKGEKMSVAFGYALKTSPEQDIDEVFKEADRNMYHNKKRMKNNYRENHT